MGNQNPLTKEDFRNAAEALPVTSCDLSEDAAGLIIKAFQAHGVEFRNEIKKRFMERCEKCMEVGAR